MFQIGCGHEALSAWLIAGWSKSEPEAGWRTYLVREMADVQVNLLPKHDRDAQSHEIAKRIRTMVLPVARRNDANVKIAEVPPGPPVLQTLVAEIYGPDYARQMAIAKDVQGVFDRTAGGG